MSARRQPAARLDLSLQVATRSAGVPTAAQLRRWANAVLEAPAQVCLRIANAREVQRLNRVYRRKDRPTNVLSFRYDDSGDSVCGDIVLCAPVIRSEARAQGKTLLAHYAHLTIHGLLHLQGYDHVRARDAKIMEAQESEIMHGLGYPDPYAGEARSSSVRCSS